MSSLVSVSTKLLMALKFYFLFLCKSPDTQGLKASSRCVGYNDFFARGRCHVLLGLKQGYPLLQSIQMGYHQSEVWPVEQKALPPNFA